MPDMRRTHYALIGTAFEQQDEIKRLEAQLRDVTAERDALREALAGLLAHHDKQLDRMIGGWRLDQQAPYRNSPECVAQARAALSSATQERDTLERRTGGFLAADGRDTDAVLAALDTDDDEGEGATQEAGDYPASVTPRDTGHR